MSLNLENKKAEYHIAGGSCQGFLFKALLFGNSMQNMFGFPRLDEAEKVVEPPTLPGTRMFSCFVTLSYWTSTMAGSHVGNGLGVIGLIKPALSLLSSAFTFSFLKAQWHPVVTAVLTRGPSLVSLVQNKL